MKSLPVALRTVAAGLPYACSACGILLNGIWAQRTGQLRWHTARADAGHRRFVVLTVLAGNRVWLMMGMFCLAGFTSQAYLPAFWTLPTIAAGQVGGGHRGGADLPGQSGRIRRAVALRLS